MLRFKDFKDRNKTVWIDPEEVDVMVESEEMGQPLLTLLIAGAELELYDRKRTGVQRIIDARNMGLDTGNDDGSDEGLPVPAE